MLLVGVLYLIHSDIQIDVFFFAIPIGGQILCSSPICCWSAKPQIQL